jgi:hypothetical protein
MSEFGLLSGLTKQQAAVIAARFTQAGKRATVLPVGRYWYVRADV